MTEISEGPRILRSNVEHDNLNDLRRVGPNKPLGFLAISRIYSEGSSIKEMRSEAASKGLKTKLFPIGIPIAGLGRFGVSLTSSGAFFVYDEEALRHFLDKNRNILEKNKWPTDPNKFINKVTSEDVPNKTELFDVVADAFADYKNTGRLKPGQQPSKEH